MPPFNRAIVIVLDSVGVGELPDADRYGDRGSNTLGNIARQVPLRVPTLRSLGLDRVVDLGRSADRRPERIRGPRPAACGNHPPARIPSPDTGR